MYELVTLYGFVGIVMIGMSNSLWWLGHVVRKGRQLYRNLV